MLNRMNEVDFTREFFQMAGALGIAPGAVPFMLLVREAYAILDRGPGSDVWVRTPGTGVTLRRVVPAVGVTLSYVFANNRVVILGVTRP